MQEIVDYSEVKEAVRNAFYEKYAGRIEGAIRSQIESVRENPSKEMALLSALEPFLSEGAALRVSRVREGLTAYETARKLAGPERGRSGQAGVSAAAIDPSVREDGVYDVDGECLLRRNGANTGVNTNMNPMAAVLMFSVFGGILTNG